MYFLISICQIVANVFIHQSVEDLIWGLRDGVKMYWDTLSKWWSWALILNFRRHLSLGNLRSRLFHFFRWWNFWWGWWVACARDWAQGLKHLWQAVYYLILLFLSFFLNYLFFNLKLFILRWDPTIFLQVGLKTSSLKWVFCFSPLRNIMLFTWLFKCITDRFYKLL